MDEKLPIVTDAVVQVTDATDWMTELAKTPPHELLVELVEREPFLATYVRRGAGAIYLNLQQTMPDKAARCAERWALELAVRAVHMLRRGYLKLDGEGETKNAEDDDGE